MLGSKGGVLRGIEEKAGAQVVIDQSTRNAGYSTARFRGSAEAVKAARALVERSLAGHENKKAEQSQLVGRAGEVLDEDDVASLDMTVEQQDVGWLLGSAGETVREIEQKSGAKIEVDQSTKAQGYSMIAITGAPEKVDAARDLVQKVLEKRRSSIEAADALGTQTQGTVDYTVEQRHVGWLLGSRGAVVQEMQRKSGARITVDQACRDEGYSIVRIQGSAESMEAARALIEGSIRKHAPKGPEPAEKERIADQMFLASEGDVTGDQVDLDQYLVQWLFSNDRAVVGEIEHANSVEISLDEGTSADGYSTLLLKGAATDVMAAREAIYDSILRFLVSPSPSCNASASCSSAEETSFHTFVIGQEHVAWLLGKGGSTVKGIQEKSGARITVEQGVPGPGQSTVRIKGQPLEVMTARMLIGRSLAGHGAREVPHGELRVEQELVAWIMGKQGAVLNEIEENTGTTILLDQRTQEQGYSTVRILGRPVLRREAMELIKASLDCGRKAILKPGLSEPKPLTGVRKKRGGWTDPTKRIGSTR